MLVNGENLMLFPRWTINVICNIKESEILDVALVCDRRLWPLLLSFQITNQLSAFKKFIIVLIRNMAFVIY